jgi:Flp pilus assembly pilin Flp
LTTPGEINEALRRFRRSQHGSAAIEFAIVAPLFFALLFATLELALMIFAGQVLERVTQDSARLIFTNQAQEQDWNADVFKTKLCENMRLPLFTCDGISVDVKVFSKFSVINLADLADRLQREAEDEFLVLAASSRVHGCRSRILSMAAVRDPARIQLRQSRW